MGEESNDVTKLREALRKEREGHRAATAALKNAQDRVAELEQQTALGETPSAAKVSDFIAASVAARVAAKTGELQKQLAALEAQLGEATAAKAAVEAKLNRRTLDDVVRAAATEAHIRTDAMADVLTIGSLELQLSSDGTVGTKDGQDVHQWLDARKSVSPHWWPASRGAGARGSGNESAPPELSNPFAPGESWSLTRQGEVLRASPDRAAMLQRQAAAMPKN